MDEPEKDVIPIVRRAREGDPTAWDELIPLVSDKVRYWDIAQPDSGLRAKCSSSDLLQNFLITLTRQLSAFRGNSSGEFWSWCYEIIRGTHIDQHRKFLQTRRRDARKERSADQSNGGNGKLRDELAAPHSTPSMQAARNERSRALSEAMKQLTEKQRQAVTLVDFDGKSTKDAADEMGRPETTIASLLFRGRQKLRCLLEKTIKRLE